MIAINVKDLITVVPDLINLFLPGFIFMCVYNWINSKNSEASIMTMWSLFISTLISSFYTTIHMFVLSNVKIPDAIKIITFSATGAVLAMLSTSFKQNVVLSSILSKINNRSVNDDIFDDIIDYDKRTHMRVYLKASDVYYLGRFSFREEKGNDSWISMIYYIVFDKKTNKKIFSAEDNGMPSSVAINLGNVERIELIYEDDSNVWKKLINE